MREVVAVVFDWNGTLLKDNHAFWAAVTAIFHSNGKVPPTPREYFTELRDDYLNIYKNRGITFTRDEANKIYHAEYVRHRDSLQLNQCAEEILQWLCEQGISTHLLSLQPKETADPIFERLHILRYFESVIMHALNKEKELRALLAKDFIMPKHCMMVGDAPADIRHAKAAGVIAVAYDNGFVPRDLLEAEKPDYIIKSLCELAEIIL